MSYSTFGAGGESDDNGGMGGQLFCDDHATRGCGQRVPVSSAGLWERAAADVSDLGRPAPRSPLLSSPVRGPLWGHPSQPILGANVGGLTDEGSAAMQPSGFRASVREVGDDGEGRRSGGGQHVEPWEGGGERMERAEDGETGGGRRWVGETRAAGGIASDAEIALKKIRLAGGKGGEMRRAAEGRVRRKSAKGEAAAADSAAPDAASVAWPNQGGFKEGAASLVEVRALRKALGRIEGEVVGLTSGMKMMQRSMALVATAKASANTGAATAKALPSAKQPAAAGAAVGTTVGAAGGASARGRNLPFSGELDVVQEGVGKEEGHGEDSPETPEAPEKLLTGGMLDQASSGAIGMASPEWTRTRFPGVNNAGDMVGGTVGDIDHLTSDASPRSAYERQLVQLVATTRLRPLQLHPSTPLNINEEVRSSPR